MGCSTKKKQTSSFDERKLDEVKIDQRYMPQSFGMNKIQSLPSASNVADRFLTGVELSAATSLPVFNLANVRIQWGLRVPTEMKKMFRENDGLFMNKPPAVSFQNIPFLVMNKISVEQAGGRKHKEIRPAISEVLGKDNVSIMCIGLKHQLEALSEESGMLKKVVEDLRSEMSNGKLNPFAGEIKRREAVRVGNKSNMDCKADIKIGRPSY